MFAVLLKFHLKKFQLGEQNINRKINRTRLESEFFIHAVVTNFLAIFGRSICFEGTVFGANQKVIRRQLYITLFILEMLELKRQTKERQSYLDAV